MDYDKNVASHPEQWGLTVVAEIEYSSGSYEFDTRIVWKDADGKLFTARDSGCSCPTPFENFNTFADIDTFNYDELVSETEERLKSGCCGASPLQVREFLKEVKAAMPAS